jgi:uncharacterized membrane protein
MTEKITLAKGLNYGLRKAMEDDPKVLIMGEDVGKLGGVFRITDGLQKDFGEDRVIDSPLAESGIVGTAVGMAMRGYRPVVEIQFGVAAPPLLVLALVVEGTDVVHDPAAAGIALLYLAVVNSILGLGLLGILVRARGAGAAASVFFLMPPVTAVLAWLVLGETLDAREVVGLVITVVGVAAATRAAPAEQFEPVVATEGDPD